MVADPLRRALLVGGLALPMAAVAAEVSPAEAPTDHSYTDQAFIIAGPDRFPGIDPTGFLDSAPGLQEAFAETPPGGTIIIPPGLYKLHSRITVFDGRSINVIAHGATFVQSSDNPVFTVLGPYEEILPVSSANRIVASYGSGTAEVTQLILPAGAPGWSKGDLVKIVADDGIPGAREAQGELRSRVGEFAIVDSVTSGEVRLNHLLRGNYTQNIRATRVNKQSIRWSGGTFQTAPELKDKWLGPIMSFANLVRPIISDVTINVCSGIGVQVVSCFAYEIRNLAVNYSPNQSSQQQYGYGILDNSCNHGRVIGGTFRHVRHGYTDDTPQIAPGSSIHSYGGTYATLILGAHTFGSTAAAFDTHHCSEATHFLGCHAVGGTPLSSTSVGFQLRGRNHRVSSCSVDMMPVGLSVVNESAGGDSFGHTVDNLFVSQADETAIVSSVRGSSHPLAMQWDSRVNLQARNITVVESRRFMSALNSTVRLSGSSYVAPAGVSGSYYSGLRTTNSHVDFQDVLFDYSLNSAGIPQPFNSSPSSNAIPGIQMTRLQNVDIRINFDAAERAGRPFHGTGHDVYGKSVSWSHPFPSMPGVLSAGSSLQWACDYSETSPRSDLNSGFTFMNAAMLAGPLHWLNRSIDSTQFVQTNPRGENIVAQTFPPGKVRGQTLIIWQDGKGTWTIGHGGNFRTALLGDEPVVMRDGDQIRVVWDGASWRQVP